MSKSKKAKHFICFAAAISGGLSLINHFIEAGSVKGILRTSNGNFYETPHGRLYYEEFGTGATPLLLIHNASPMDSSYEWNYVREECRTRFHVYTIDLLGFGRSDKPNIEYTNYLFAILMNDFIRNVIAKPVHVCATGLSSSFAVTAAGLDPSLYLSITMINPSSLATLKKTVHSQAHGIRTLLNLPFLGTTIYYIVNSRSEVELRAKEQYFYNPFLIQQSTIDAMYETSHSMNGRGKYILASLNGGYLYWDISKSLSSLSIPLFLLYGEHAEKVEEIAEEYVLSNPNLKALCIPKTKWMPQLEDPKSVTAHLISLPV